MEDDRDHISRPNDGLKFGSCSKCPRPVPQPGSRPRESGSRGIVRRWLVWLTKSGLTVYFSLFGRQMEIDLLHLEPEGQRLRVSFEALEPGALRKPEQIRPLRVELTAWVRPEGGVVRVSGEVDSTVAAECDRCLKPLELVLAGSFDQRYVFEAAASGIDVDETEVEASELDLEELASGVLDMREVAREQAVLLAPMHVLCSDTCAGLCPSCGVDLNATSCNCTTDQIDPRWEALQRLKNS